MTTLERPPDGGVVLRQLSERVGLSSYLGLLQDGRVTVVEVAEATGSPYLEDFEVGLDVSAHATALGKALLVAMPPRERHRFLRSHELCPFTTRTRTDPEVLEAELGAVRGGAAVIEHGEFRDGVSCTASLVPRRTAEEPAWAVVVAVADEDVPANVSRRGGPGRRRPGRQLRLMASSLGIVFRPQSPARGAPGRSSWRSGPGLPSCGSGRTASSRAG